MRLWTALEIMLHFQALLLLQGLDMIQEEAAKGSVSVTPQAGLPISGEWRERYILLTQFVKHQCEHIRLESAIDRCERIEAELLPKDDLAVTWREITSQFKTLIEAIHHDMKSRRFAWITEAKGKVQDQTVSLWEPIWMKFPKAKYDIEEAVHCYALERNTACVFHMMRVAEYGIRAVVRRYRLPVPGVKKLALEFSSWGELRNALRDRCKHLESNVKRSAKRSAALEFYSGCLLNIEGFKEPFRDSVMHTRKRYDEYQAASAMFHVREFMTRLL